MRSWQWGIGSAVFCWSLAGAHFYTWLYKVTFAFLVASGSTFSPVTYALAAS
jgi:hypothetical protein